MMRRAWPRILALTWIGFAVLLRRARPRRRERRLPRVPRRRRGREAVPRLGAPGAGVRLLPPGRRAERGLRARHARRAGGLHRVPRRRRRSGTRRASTARCSRRAARWGRWRRTAGTATAPTTSGPRPTPPRPRTSSTSRSRAASATARAPRSRAAHEMAQTSILRNYSMSLHAKGVYEKGLIGAAVCTSCHTAHDILPRTDPASSIHPDHVVETCRKCHQRDRAGPREGDRGPALGGGAGPHPRLRRLPRAARAAPPEGHPARRDRQEPRVQREVPRLPRPGRVQGPRRSSGTASPSRSTSTGTPTTPAPTEPPAGPAASATAT